MVPQTCNIPNRKLWSIFTKQITIFVIFTLTVPGKKLCTNMVLLSYKTSLFQRKLQKWSLHRKQITKRSLLIYRLFLQEWFLYSKKLHKWSLPDNKFIEMVPMFHKSLDIVPEYQKIYIHGSYVSQSYRNVPCFSQNYKIIHTKSKITEITPTFYITKEIIIV